MNVLDKLAGGDRRSIGRANEIVADVLRDPSQFRVVFDGMLNADPVIRMRAADIVEKVAGKRPDLLQPLAQRLLDQLANNPPHEVQRHAAQVLPRIALTEAQRTQAEKVLMTYLNGRSSILRASALTALADLALRDPKMRERIAPLVANLAQTGTAAVRARGRKLLGQIGLTAGGDGSRAP